MADRATLLETSADPVQPEELMLPYPEHFPPGSTLGPFVDKCRQRIGGSNEILSQADTDELRAILDYANKFHHDTNPAYETEQINDTELESFARRTLAFTKRA